MTGEALYHAWCGSSVTDRARYWDLMNPADKESWEELARDLTPRQEESARGSVAVKALETIATFDGGRAGDIATEVLKSLGIWSEEATGGDGELWLAFYHDFSDLAVFTDELEARRYADDGGGMMVVSKVRAGAGLRGQV